MLFNYNIYNRDDCISATDIAIFFCTFGRIIIKKNRLTAKITHVDCVCISYLRRYVVQGLIAIVMDQEGGLYLTIPVNFV